MPEQLAAEVGVGDITQQLRVQLAPLERLAVGVEGDLLLGATVDVVEHGPRQLAFGDRTEVVGQVHAAQHPLDRVTLEAAELDELEDFVEVHVGSPGSLTRCW